MMKPASPYDIPITLFLFSAALGLLPAYAPQTGLQPLVAIAAGTALYWIISRLSPSSRPIQGALVALALVCALFSLFIITQAGNLSYEEKIGPITALTTQISSHFPKLTLWNPMSNSVGTFLESSLFLILGLGLSARGQKKRWAYFIITALMALALLFSTSRGAWLAVLGAGLAWVALRWNPARILVLAVLAGILGLLLNRPDRLDLYRNSLALIADVPFSGLGLGDQFTMAYSHYGLLIQVPFLTYSHNLFLQIWLEQGLAGIASWLWLCAALLSVAWLTPRRLSGWLAESSWVGLMAVLLHAISDARQTQDAWTWLPFFFLLGLNASCLRSAPTSQNSRAAWVPAVVPALFLVGVAVLFSPLQSTFLTNLASLQQQRADLAPGLDPATRAGLRVQAEAGLKQALALNPANRSANERLGLIFFDAGNFPAAITHLRTAYTADPGHPAVRKAFGLAQAFNQDYASAETLLQGIPGIVDELNTWGAFFSANGHPEPALHAYRMSFILAPSQAAVRTEIDRIEQNLKP